MLKDRYLYLEKKLCEFLRPKTIVYLRYAIGIVYLWYGLLKIFGISPVEELVYHATHWIGTHNFVIFLGVWEVGIGLLLLIRKTMRFGLWLLFLQFPGTFLPLFLNPEDCFTAIPYGLTLEGQYIFKNLVMIAAALVLLVSLHSTQKK